MPNTRKKIIKTVYKDENDSDIGDFSDSGSEAYISPAEESTSEEESENVSSCDDNGSTDNEFIIKKNNNSRCKKIKTSKRERSNHSREPRNIIPPISIKDLTDSDKLLPTVLNLSESDSSDDEATTSQSTTQLPLPETRNIHEELKNTDSSEPEFTNVSTQKESDEVAKKAFLELELHKNKIEQTKSSVQSYSITKGIINESNVEDLLAQGETSDLKIKSLTKNKKIRKDSDSEIEDWEEVHDNVKPSVPQNGLQLIVDFPGAVNKKTKQKQDLEMMMRRKINRVKKEYQVHMHKVHVLCWIAHGNYISQVLNDQQVLSAALTLVPSKECYPGERVDMKYIEQITTWYRDKVTLKQDKNEHKFKPKAPPVKDILMSEITSRTVSTKKNMVCIFVSLLRALGLQCRIMLNFVTLPLKPPHSELCSLSTKNTGDSNKASGKVAKKKLIKDVGNIPQVDGIYDGFGICENFMQVDGNDDMNNSNIKTKTMNKKSSNITKKPQKRKEVGSTKICESPPKKVCINYAKSKKLVPDNICDNDTDFVTSFSDKIKVNVNQNKLGDSVSSVSKNLRSTKCNSSNTVQSKKIKKDDIKTNLASNISLPPSPKIKPLNKEDKIKPKLKKESNKIETCELSKSISSCYFTESNKDISTPKRCNSRTVISKENEEKCIKNLRKRTRSVPVKTEEQKSEFFSEKKSKPDKSKNKQPVSKTTVTNKNAKSPKQPDIQSKKGDSKNNKPKKKENKSDDDFELPKTKQIPQVKACKKIDRRVLSSDDEQVSSTNKTDVWCEVFVEELEQWISVDVYKGKVHCPSEIYSRATHPVAYIVGWDNRNYLKDLTRKYVPHWNTETRKLRVEQSWWNESIQPWLGPKTARDREEDEYLDKMQSEAPLPKSVAEYKNHPLYALQRHLLKFEAIYPPEPLVLGFVRGEAVYSRDCVYTCRSRDTWLKEAKVVRLGEKPYKIVKARPKWDKLSNKLITDKPLELFGPWQVQDYEPPVAENGLVPRNAYGNVELFKDCMLPKGTVHIKLPGLNRVAKKLNIDCAPAMTGFEFNGGWSHPVYDGFVVCKEFEELVTEAWLKDQEQQERREREKTESRIYENWKKLIKGLLINDRLKKRYGFENPTNSQDKKKKGKTPKLVVKKK